MSNMCFGPEDLEVLALDLRWKRFQLFGLHWKLQVINRGREPLLSNCRFRAPRWFSRKHCLVYSFLDKVPRRLEG